MRSDAIPHGGGTTMWLFASYSRKDETAVRGLISDLQRAHLSVWHDQELRGGDPWWQDILRRIRQCDVFLFLLSDNSLASKPCLTELSYARALGLPILPVQVGPVGNIRLTPVADIQVVDYRERTLAKGMELLDAIQQAVTERHPLPEPLPEPPSVPFEYLLRLGSAIGAAQLTPDQQGDFIRQLREVLETEDDEGVKDDAHELLRALRRRPDITYRNAQAIDRLLADLAAATTPVTVRGASSAGEGPPASPTAADDHEPQKAGAGDVGAGGRPGRRLRTGLHAASSGRPERLRRTRRLLTAGALLLALAALGAIWLLGRGDTIPPSDVVLAQPAADVGPEPFAESAAAGQGEPPISLAGAVSGATPGLYGGTGTNSCNAQGLADFLEKQPTLAAAWGTALGISVEQVRTFLGGLTPVTLRTDTAITNHGFRDDRAVPFQAVLQAGTAVLIDAYGEPKVRCACGNPLQPPEQQADMPYEGPRWPGFEAETVTEIKPAPSPVEEFVVLRQDTGDFVARPQGTQGDQDDHPDTAAEQRARELPTSSAAGSPSDDGGAGEQSNEGGENASGNGTDDSSTVPGENPGTAPGNGSGEGTEDGPDSPSGGTAGDTEDDVQTRDRAVEGVLPGGTDGEAGGGSGTPPGGTDGETGGGSGTPPGGTDGEAGGGSGTPPGGTDGETGGGSGTPPGGTDGETGGGSGTPPGGTDGETGGGSGTPPGGTGGETGGGSGTPPGGTDGETGGGSGTPPGGTDGETGGGSGTPPGGTGGETGGGSGTPPGGTGGETGDGTVLVPGSGDDAGTGDSTVPDADPAD
ncbi:DUF6777 domain-containing protein [Geodermatophilus obscurus]|nr:DUF6777 domain-containing protein [Geodermatophilus obscurus]